MTETVGLVLKPGAAEAREAALAVRALLPEARLIVERDGPHAVASLRTELLPVERETFERESSLVVVLGGDGTLIHAASLLPTRVVPVLGINLGRIGFLSEVARDELAEVLPRALAGELAYSDRLRFDARVVSGREEKLSLRILNDAVVAQFALARLARYRVSLDDELITFLRGDGVIISTPTGSTAYSMAAGGPIVMPGVAAMTVTPICPHSLTQRPLVLPVGRTLQVALESEDSVFVTLDGQLGQEFRPGDILEVSAAKVPLRLLQVPRRSHFEILRRKLRWGES